MKHAAAGDAKGRNRGWARPGAIWAIPSLWVTHARTQPHGVPLNALKDMPFSLHCLYGTSPAARTNLDHHTCIALIRGCLLWEGLQTWFASDAAIRWPDRVAGRQLAAGRCSRACT